MVLRMISIHAPREGGDGDIVKICEQKKEISIHAPREGGDVRGRRVVDRDAAFQSTPPARGATMFMSSPPSVVVISIHAPREGGDG